MNAVMDEIGEIVRDNITTPKEARRIKALADDFLPCERMGDQWPQNIAADIDLELATEFPIINLNAILRLLHPKKFRGVPAPRFASFNAFKDSVCVIHVDKLQDEQAMQNSARASSVAFAASLVPPKPQPVEEHAVAHARTGPMLWTSHSFMLEWVSLTAKFTGIIPSECRKKIKDTAHKFDVTLLIQEVVEWSAQVERIADPLVIGVKNGVHYLIDRFDTTTLEEYVAREFSA